RNSFSSRMSTEQQDPGNFFKDILLHFKAHRVKISFAIKTPFPFFEILRDTELITEEMYDNFRDSCMNRVPVKRVAYRALEILENKFDLEVLRVLFSEENMKAYPDLKFIARSFENVSQNKLCFHGSDRGYPNSQLCLEQGPGDSCSEESLTLSPSASSSSDGWRNNDRRNTTLIQGNQTENHQSSGFQIDNESCELKLNDRHPHLEPHSPLPRNEERAVLLSHGSQTQPCSVHLVDIKKENSSFSLDGEQQTQARTNHNQASEIIVLSSDDSDDGNNSEEESTSIICQSKPLDSREPHTSRITNKRRGRKRDRHGKYSIRNIKMPLKINWIKAAFKRRRINSSSRRSRKRGRRIPRQRNVDFNRPELPVTCGSATGTLYKEKYQQGIHEKSIQSETGQWFTLRQFEIKGGREKSKNWRQSIRCYGWTLKELIKKKHLPNPPRKKKENPQNPQRTKKKVTAS
uniref:Nuclear antigen Sp100 n=1 Tax=Peromyscus maniculatus bairdii TaxID=230844 RepID=A0A8C8UG45_PERMB